MVATGAAAQADTVPAEPEYDWPEFRRLEPGDTLVVPDTATHSVFVLDRRQREVEEILRRRTDLRLEAWGNDTTRLKDRAAKLDSALLHCRTRAGALEGVVEIDSVAIERLRASQPGFFERVGEGLAWLGAGTLVGTAGDCIVD